MKIVSGRTGLPHVTSQQFRQMLEGIIGQGSYIITSGENLKPELSSNNLLKIRSGMMAHHGCISCVDIGTYDEVTLTNGSQGMKRIDLIVNRYTRNAETEVENCGWKVIQGKPVASNPAVPAYTSGNLQNGDLVDECPAFEVHYDGINVTEVKSLLSVTDGLSELSSNLVKTAVYMNNGAYNIAPSNSEFQGTDFSKKIFDNIGLMHNYDATNYKHTFTVPQDGIYLIHAYMNFQEGVTKQLGLYAKLERNNVEQSRQSKLIGPYNGADFMFLNEINAGDKIRFTVLQSSGSVIQVSGGCRLNIIRMGK